MKQSTRRMMAKFILSLMVISAVCEAQETPADYNEILTILGRKGDFSQGVLKVGIPRTDLHVTVSGIPVPTSFGFGGWLAFTRGMSEMDVMMGDLVLLEDEVNPVMSALLNNGFEVTALHNHFFWEHPRIFYMHVHGHGRAADLAHRVKIALDLIGHVAHAQSGSSENETAQTKSPAGKPFAEGKLNSQRLDEIIAHKGEFLGPVYKVTVGRDDLTLKDMGAVINSRMGLNTWAALYGTDQNAVIAGDVAMLDVEVNAVLKALRENGLEVVAIHHHMTGTNPTIIFLHYWGAGPAEKLATGFKAALNQLGR